MGIINEASYSSLAAKSFKEDYTENKGVAMFSTQGMI